MSNIWKHLKSFSWIRLANDDRPHERNFVTSTKSSRKRALDVCVTGGPTTVFGELMAAVPVAVAQFDAIYGIRDKTDIETFVDGTSGSVTVVDNNPGYEFRMRTGTGLGGYGVVRSKRSARYRPGQGLECRIGARFGEPTNLMIQRVGFFNIGNEVSFGYVNNDFGVLRRTGGRGEIRDLSITTSSAGNETLTIDLNGSSFTVSVTASTIPSLAWEISQFSFTGWDAYSTSNTVAFIARSVDPKNGTYSLTTTGSAVGAFSQILEGASVTDDFITQASWNIDPLDGVGNSAFVLNPQKGNVYKCEFQYLGYGALNFYIGDPASGDWVAVHQIRYGNANETVNLDVPNFKAGGFIASLGSTTDTSCYIGSAGIFNQGEQHPFRNPDGHVSSQLSVGTTFTNILSIRNGGKFAQRINQQRVLPLLADIAVDGTKPAEIIIYVDAEMSGDQLWKWHDFSTSCLEFMDEALACSTGAATLELAPAALPRQGGIQIDLKDLEVALEREQTLTIAVRATQSTTDATAALTWLED